MTLRTKIGISNLLGSIKRLGELLLEVPKINSVPGVSLMFEPKSRWAKTGNVLFHLFLWFVFVGALVTSIIPAMVFVWCSGKLLGLLLREKVMCNSLLEWIDFAVSGEILNTRHERP